MPPPNKPTKKSLKNTLKTACILTLLLANQNLCSNNITLTQTKTKLQQLEIEIKKLQVALKNTKDKQGTLNQALATTEKEISLNINKLHETLTHLNNKQQTITKLKKQVDWLSKQQQSQQQVLVKHIRARYMMGEYQPLKWLLSQNQTSSTSRLLTYYQYVIQSDQNTIKNIRQTQLKLAKNQNKLQLEIKNLQQLEQQLEKTQQKLTQNKNHSQAIILALNQTIQSKQQQLIEYQHNQQNLSQLVQSLNRQSFIPIQRPFIYAFKKLPHPLQTKTNSFQKMNQGLVFFAHEGTPVKAVYPGKIVFSDWLKGYGLLLIIDHGRGFMTLYAHNESLFKQKGDTINQGEKIATVGHTGGIKENGLYFEIRQRGKAIPPLRWLA